MIELNKKKAELTYMRFLERDEKPLAASVIGGGFCSRENMKELLGLDNSALLLFVNDYIISHIPSTKSFLKDFGQKLEQEPKRVTNILDSVPRRGMKYSKALKKLTKNLNTISDKELSIRLKKVHQISKKYCALYILSLLDKLLLERAQIMYKKYSATFDEDMFMELVTCPAGLTYSDMERDNILKLTIRSQNSRLQDNDIIKHINKYGWLSIKYYRGDVWTYDQIVDRIENILSPTKELKVRVSERKLKNTELKKIYAVVTKQEQEIIKTIRKAVQMRTMRAELFEKGSEQVVNILDEVVLRTGYIRNDLRFLNFFEVADLVMGKDMREVIELRKENYILKFNNQGDLEILDGEDFKEYINRYPELRDPEVLVTAEVKGVPAHPGKVKGLVKVIEINDDLLKIERGDIMVCTMTYPSFIAGMEKAAAFVTDEGGILCHAAIVSREMSKPCIIATGHATKVFKDGDLVEVDADNGIVRIIEPTN